MKGFVWLLQVLLRPFLLTALVEGLLAFCLFRSIEVVYASFLCNLMTNPALNLLLILMTSLVGIKVYYPSLIVLEVMAIYLEGRLYQMICQWDTVRAMRVSLLLNAVSVLSGFLILK